MSGIRTFALTTLSLLVAGCGSSNSQSTPASAASANTSATSNACSQNAAGQFVIQGRSVSAIVDRDPLRIRYLDANGQIQLAEVANILPNPFTPTTVPGLGGGADTIPDHSLYSPFTFEVGGHAATQFPGSPWQGNQLLGGDAGVQFSATRLLKAECQGSVAILTLATNDPSGRQITVKIQPDESGLDALQVQAKVSPDTAVVAFSDSFDAASDEAFFGFGGRHNALSQRGNSFPIWVEQENFGAGALQPAVNAMPGTGGNGYQFPNGQTTSYYPQALFYSSRPYAFMLENSDFSRFKMAYSDKPDAWQVSVASSEIRYVVALGDVNHRVQTITGINGRHRVAPDWALGPTLLRGIRVLSSSADTADSYTAKANADLDRVLKDKLPITSYSIEGWDFVNRPQLASLVDRIRAQAWHPMMYIRAYSARDGGNTENSNYFTEVLTQGYCGKLPAGNVCYLFGSPFITGVAAVIDYTNKAAVKWWGDRIRLMLDLGADGFMEDFGESVMTDMVFANGETGLTMHNKYPTIYHATTRAVLDQYKQDHPDRAALAQGDFYFFNRAGFSGRKGSAAYEVANFPGDNMTDWSRSNGLASSTSDMLNRGVGGAYGYTTDIGGYLDEITGATSKELFIRWSQFAALTPIFRVHNSSTNGVRMPWDFDAETEASWAQMAQLHIRAKPLIMQLWRDAQVTGLPITRPLWLMFPADTEGYKQDQEFMLGDNVLVAPVVTEGATMRDVYFPQGCWSRPETGEQFQGPKHIAVSAPLLSLPYFFRCGTQPF